MAPFFNNNLSQMLTDFNDILYIFL